MRTPDDASERRLHDLRTEAETRGRVSAAGVRPPGAPFPIASSETGYYGLPLLKPPVWTWEVPVYFFVGGAAGVAAVIAEAARITGAEPRLVRDARLLAAAGANLSAPLLISDLGRPERFLNMLRVFKLQSPMSVGAWTVAAFGAFATTAAVADEVVRRTQLPAKGIAQLAGTASAATGLAMATYTGVLLGATTIPVWSRHAGLLPAHFGASAVGAAVSILELRGHRHPALNTLGIASALFENFTGFQIESDRAPESAPLREGRSGLVTRLGGLLSGPVPLALRVVGVRSKKARRLAAAATIAGSLITRLAWVAAGKTSAAQSNTGSKRS